MRRLQPPGAGHVIGMHIAVQRRQQMQATLLHRCKVVRHLLVDRVNQHGFAAAAVAQQAGIGRRIGIEQLAKDAQREFLFEQRQRAVRRQRRAWD